MSHTLRQSSLAKEGPLQVSMWLHAPVLLDHLEMEALFEAMGDFSITQIDRLVNKGEGFVSKENALKKYEEYVSLLKNGENPPEHFLKESFQVGWSISSELYYSIKVAGGRQIIKANLPIVLLQPHKIDYSAHDGQFRSMVMGAGSITWGVQFSYPQLFQDPKTMKVHKISRNEAFPNSEFYHRLQVWVRHHTLPTSFIVGSKKCTVSYRLGKNCFEWINNHPQLISKGIQVASRSSQKETML